MAAEALAVEYSAPADVAPEIHKLVVAASATDLFGPIAGKGLGLLSVTNPSLVGLSLDRSSESIATDAAGRATYDLTVVNTANRSTGGDVAITERLPNGTTATGAGTGWSCATTNGNLACVLPAASYGGVLKPGDALVPVKVNIDFPDNVRGTTQVVQGTVRAAKGGGDASTGSFVIPAVPPPVPKPQFGLTTAPVMLQRDGKAVATVTLKNTGTAPLPAGTFLGLVVEAGAGDLAVTNAGVGLTCQARTSGRAATACRLNADLPAGATLTPAIAIDVPVRGNAPDKMNLSAGVVTVTGNPVDPIAAAVDSLVGAGSSVLKNKVALVTDVKGLGADAGAPQTVFDVVHHDDGTDQRTVVTMDGSSSHSPDDQALTFEWIQTSGPAITWQTVAGTVNAAPPGSPPKPFASGDHPKFTAPRVQGNDPVVLGFQVTVRHPTAGSRTAATTVTVQPAPNRPPVLSNVTASAGRGTTPPPGTRIALTSSVTDPDGDRVTRTWRVIGGDGPVGLAISNSANSGKFTWPTNTNFVVVEVTASDGRSGVDTAQLTLGTAPPPLTISAAGPSGPVAPGTPVTINATVTGAAANQVTWVWQQLDGPPADPALINPVTVPSVTFPAPAASGSGQAVRIKVTGTRGSGATATADDAVVTVQLAETPAPTVVITGGPAATPNQPVSLTASAVGAGPFTFAWSQSSGPGGSFSSTNTATTTFTAPRDGIALVTVNVTDAAGRVGSASLPLVVGTPFVPSANAPSCADAATLAGRAFAAATQGQPFAGSIGPVSFELGQLTVTNPCGGANAELAVANASFGIAGGVVTGTGLSGFLREDRLCVTGGQLRFPEAWGLSAVQLGTGSPLCLLTAPNVPAPVTGSLTATGLPFLKLPPGTAPPTTTIDFNGSVLHVHGHGTLPTGGTLDVDLLAQPGGAFTANAIADDINVLGQTLDLTGSITGNGSAITTLDVHGSIPGPLTLVPGVTLTNIDVKWGLTGATIHADANVGNGTLLLTLDGSFIDSANFTFTLAAKTGGPPITLLPGLSVSSAQFVGTVGASAGVVTFDVQTTVGGGWQPIPGGPVSLDSLGARFANVTPPPECPGIAPGGVWFALTGAATIQVGTQPVKINAVACAGGGGAWSLTSTATFGSWKPVANLDATVESIGFQVLAPNGGTDITISLQGGARVLGVNLGAKVVIRPLDLAIAVDMSGDLSGAGLGLPSGSVGHVALASVEFPNFHFDDPLLANETVLHPGLTALAGFAPDPGLANFLSSKFGLPPITALVVKVEIGGPSITLTASIAVGGGGIPLFTNCAAPCTPDNTTSLKLTSLFLSISVTGRIGFGATSNLHLPRSSADAPASDLGLTAEIAIDLAGPVITLALYTSDGTWHNALGINGLDMADLAIQGGVNFASPVPVPTVGFGATVVRLPDPMAQLIGADPNNQEAMSFVLNISQTAPILMIQVGVQDGHIALKPLRSFGQAAGDALQIDYAKLVFAPLGGTVGPYTFLPGMGFGFAAQIMGVPVEVGASVSVSPALIDAHVNVGTIDLGSVVLDNVNGQFRIDTTGLLVDLDASLTLPSADPNQPSPNIQAALTINADLGGFRAHFEGSASNWTFGSFAKINTFTIKGDLPQFALAIEGDGTILGTNVGIKGAVSFAGLELQTANLQVTAGTFRIGTPALGVTVSGPGCDGIKGGANAADDGACVKVGYDKAIAQPFSGFVGGEVTANGATVAFSGGLDSKGVTATGSLKFGTTNLAVTGKFYSGTTAALANTKETLPDGTQVQVKTGDWKVSMAAETSTKLAGFDASLKTSAGSLNNTLFFASKGSMTLLGNTVTVTNSLSFGANLQFHTEVDINLTLDGYALGSGHLIIDSTTGVAFAGNVSLAGFGAGGAALNVRLSGSLSPRVALPGGNVIPAKFNLTAHIGAELLTVGVTLDLTFTQSSFSFAFGVDSGPLDVDFSGSVDATLKLCAHASASISIPSFPDPTGSFDFCNKGTVSERGMKVSVGVSGYNFVKFTITTPKIHFSKNFAFDGSAQTPLITFLNPVDWKDDFRLGASISFDVTVVIDSDDGVTFDGDGDASAFYKHWHDLDPDLFSENWEFGKHTIGSVGVHVHPEDREACADVGFFGVTREVCI